MRKRVVPSLSSSGWLTGLAERADHVMASYIVSDYSENYIYRVYSLPWHVQQYGHDDLVLKDHVESDLNTLFNRHFDRVEVEVTVDIPMADDPERINLQVEATVYEQGNRYDLGRLIKATRSRVVEVFDLYHGR